MSLPRSRWLVDPLCWALAALLLLTFGMPHLKPLFAALFPALDRPLYEQDSFAALLLSHLAIVALSSAVATGLGIAAGVFVTRAAGREFRPLIETLVAVGQTMPPVAVLAIAVPLIGFGALPALIALALYGLLPVLSATIAGLGSVPQGAINLYLACLEAKVPAEIHIYEGGGHGFGMLPKEKAPGTSDWPNRALDWLCTHW